MTTYTWPQLLADYITGAHATGHRAETIRTRMSYLRRFSSRHRIDADLDTMTGWLAGQEWAPSTRKSARGALRSFYSWAARTGRIDRDPTVDLPRVKVPTHLPRPAAEEHVLAGLDADSPDVVLMVRLAAEMGLRRSEIAQVRRSDVTPFGLHVVGKGGRERVVTLPPAIRAELQRRPAGWIFPGRFSGHLHPSTVQRWVRQASGMSPHPHRHRFATQAYAGTRSVFAVQRALGHASAETTQVYVEVAALDIEAAVMAAAVTRIDWQVAA